MGKIVKFCVSCDEGFAEKFGFCPTCGAQLQSFEMKPMEAGAPAAVDTPVTEVMAAEELPVTAQIDPEFSPASSFESAPPEPEFLYEAAGADVIEPEPEVQAVEEDDVVEVQAAETLAAPATSYYESTPAAPADPTAFSTSNDYYKKDDGYYVTVIQEKNVKQRNMLLLGAAAFMLILTLGGTVYSLFVKDVNVGAIDGGDLYAFVPVVEDVPMEVEEEKKKNDDDGGGGGGGGRDEETPTSQGRLANQTEKPLLNPDKSFVQKDFELQYQASTQGKRQFEQTTQPYGDPSSRFNIPSNGMGSGGGQGSGLGQGQGSGRGTGTGSGDGSGSGSGQGDGDGDGRGPGSGTSVGQPPPPPVGVTQKVKILSKPRASYTDAARQNNVQGSVTLRITFLASGQIGGISPVSGLPYGLTEQAIAAARSIRFEPAKRNGVPYTTSVTIQYGFTIY
jgi:TonB family protein